jgi:signal transduction histidine kinase
MTEIESLTHRIKELERQLQDSQATSRMYLQNVAHQLTAPLNAIKWSIEALKDAEVPIHRKGNLLSSVYSQATILVHLIKNFSLMSNLEADEHLGQVRNQEPVDPMLLAINLTNDFQPQALDQGKMRIKVDDDSFKKVLGGRKLKVERNLIAQAISNLLENAVKYADHGSTILIKCEKLADGVGVSITSIGIPISDKDAERIFERGVRGVNAQTKVPAGTGIGLYLAMRVMRLHQGSILLGRTRNVTTFTLSFPNERIK